MASLGVAVAFGMGIGGLSGCTLLAVALGSTLSVGGAVADASSLGALPDDVEDGALGESFNVFAASCLFLDPSSD